MRSLLVLFVVMIATSSISQAREVSDIVNDLRKYCPYYGFDGVLQCPDANVSKTFSKTLPPNGVAINPSYVLSGLGYDRVTRQIRFPVLPSSAPIDASTTRFQTYHMSDVNEYLNTVFSQKSVYSGGLFVLGDNYVEQFASLFGNYKVNMGIVQKEYDSYTTYASSKTIIPEFQQILYSLPTTYNPNNATVVQLYQSLLIDIFGTDVSMSSTHGGVFFQQTAIKSCYGGNITMNQESEMDTTLANKPPGNLAYMDYRSLGVFEVKGGNPEIPHTDYEQIIESFPIDPAITGFTAVPLWEIVPAEYQTAVRLAIDNYITVKQASVNAMIDAVNQQKLQSYLAAQDVYVYARQTEQYGDGIIHWDECPYVEVGDNFYTPRCSFNFQTASLGAGQDSVIVNTNFEGEGILHYESQRSPSNGTMRMWGSWTPFSGQFQVKGLDAANYNITSFDPIDYSQLERAVQETVFETAWQHTGCVSLDYIAYINDNNLLYFSACIDCLPLVVSSNAQFGLLDTDLECVCAGFNDQY